jgi:hypothetical protein
MRSSNTTLLALHGLRLKGFTETDAVAALYGIDEGATDLSLKSALDVEHVVRRDGRRAGWSLNKDGRKENERLLAEELDAAGHRATVQSAYERFLALNSTMLATCTRWQVRDAEGQVLNDHSDAAYDESVIADLRELDDGVQPIAGELAGLFDRFTIYGPRFDHALAQLATGELEWFTRPVMESYHTVWFELHEDLLATLGIDRASEQTH